MKKMVRLFNDFIRCYDDGRVERLFKRKGWGEVPNTATDKDGYNTIGCNGKTFKRHRIIGAVFLGLNIDDTTQTIDHINRDKLDNRVENLRIASRQQQSFNRTFKGYSFDKTRNKWHSKIVLNGKTISLGRYDIEQEAHQAYLDAKAKYNRRWKLARNFKTLPLILRPVLCGVSLLV